MPFGVIGRTSPGMRQVVGFGDRSTVRGTFGSEFVACHCPQKPTGRMCATAPRRSPLTKLLWTDLLHISSCNMDRLNKIFNFVSLLCFSGTGTGSGTTYQSRAKLYYRPTMADIRYLLMLALESLLTYLWRSNVWRTLPNITCIVLLAQCSNAALWYVVTSLCKLVKTVLLFVSVYLFSCLFVSWFSASNGE